MSIQLILMALGRVSGQVQVSNIVVADEAIDTASAGASFNSDGSISLQGDGAVDPSGEWWSNEPQLGIGNEYEIRCSSIISGSWTQQAATVGTWIDMSATRTWRVTRISMAGVGTNSCSANFQIRDVATQTVQASFTVTASASIV